MYMESHNESSGIYCFFPFENLDNGKGVFKIGNTEQTFQQRLSQYHTYFIHGIYIIAFIKIFAKRGKVLPINFKHILNTIENYVLKEVELNKGIILVNKKRIRNKGLTEWIYTDINTIKKCFQSTIIYFKQLYPDLGFLLDCVDIKKTIKEIDKNYCANKQYKEQYLAQYIFNVNKKDNQK